MARVSRRSSPRVATLRVTSCWTAVTPIATTASATRVSSRPKPARLRRCDARAIDRPGQAEVAHPIGPSRQPVEQAAQLGWNTGERGDRDVDVERAPPEGLRDPDRALRRQVELRTAHVESR